MWDTFGGGFLALSLAAVRQGLLSGKVRVGLGVGLNVERGGGRGTVLV